ncbi:MAG: hypothetical protein QOH21_3060 [Acidobacteriota bacterium]|jgi:hypothetical protein|nr:hypothetical protein [Acidobacteriota bacterium]
MSPHLSDDDLILLEYGELETDASHLDGCESCMHRRETLRNVLAAAGDDVIPEPPDGYENHVWRHVSWRLRPSRRRLWLTASAAAALLVIGFLAGQFSHQAIAPADRGAPAVAVVTPPTPDERLAFAAESHLDRSSRLLLEVANGEELQEHSATELVATNRLYRVMAERAGASDVARLLDELEPILLELEHGGDADAIRRRIQERELLFKLRVVRSRAAEAPQAEPQPAQPQHQPKGIRS